MSTPLVNSVTFTQVAVAGLHGTGLISLAGGTLMGPFAPAQGDRIVEIRDGSEAYAADDATDFASVVGASNTLQQYNASDLSGVTLIVVIARTSFTGSPPTDTPVSPTYFAIFTTLGLQRLAEAPSKTPPFRSPDGTLMNPVLTYLAIGDGNGAPITPSVGMTSLVHEVGRVNANLSVDPSAPSVIRVQGGFGAADGPWTVREAGVFNLANELIAVASYPDIYKSVPGDIPSGPGIAEDIRILLDVSSVAPVELSLGTVATATRGEVNAAVANGLQLWGMFS